MALTDQLSYAFEPAVIKRGEEYARHGLVKIKQANGTKAEASVRGSARYSVKLELDNATLRASCTCPYYYDCGPCKHIWATLLIAQQQGYLQEASRQARLRMDCAYDDKAGNEEDEDAWDEDESKAFVPSRHGGYAASAAGKQSASWRGLLGKLTSPVYRHEPAPRAPLPAGCVITYAIDLEESRHQRGLMVRALLSRPDKRGTLQAPRRSALHWEDLKRLEQSEDRRILTALEGASNGYSSSDSQKLEGKYRLAGPRVEAFLPAIVETGRCVLWRENQAASPPLQFDPGPPWAFKLKFSKETRGYRIEGILHRGPERMDVAEAALFVEEGYFLASHKLHRYSGRGAYDWIQRLRETSGAVVPAGDWQDFLEKACALPVLPELDLPPELNVERTFGAPRPRLHLSESKTSWSGLVILGRLEFHYEGAVVLSSDRSQARYNPKTRRILIRDLVAEGALVRTLESTGFKTAYSYEFGNAFGLPDRERLPKAVRALLAAGWEVTGKTAACRTPGEFRIEVRSGIDWFDLQGGVDFDGKRVAWPELLKALREGKDSVPLGNGVEGLLPEEWLRRFAPLAELCEIEGGEARFRRSQTALLDALLAGMPQADADAGFERARRELRTFETIEPRDPPASFAGELRGYQKEGLSWLHFLRKFGFGGCLADDMGLGKTVQVLALFEALRRERKKPACSLVVTPRSLIFNWQQEAARFTPGLRVLDFTGAARRKDASVFDGFDVALTTYGTLRRDAAFLKDVSFEYAVLDEAQAIKNAQSATAKAARLLRGRQRLALSGTPIENHLGELWSLFEFLNPGMLGRQAIFAKAGDARGGLAPEIREPLVRALRPFILRRRKEQVAKELPPKVEQTQYCALDAEQRKLYDELKEHYRQSLAQRIDREGWNRAKIVVLEALLRLRQAACHPGLLDPKRKNAPSAKLDALLPEIEEVAAEGHKALVFSQFTQFLGIVRKRLDESGIVHEYLDGKTRDRQEKVRRFQEDPGCPVFLISLKAGGVGLNLTAADYVFLLDPWWNPAVEAQAIDRTHRIGQSRSVFAYRLIAKDTVEEKVLQLQTHKRELADAIINADQGPLRSLTRADLELLLS